MAALASTAVALYPAAGNSATNSRPNEWFPAKDRNIIARSLVLTLTGQGGQTNTIGAAALGLSVILGCSSLFDDTNNLVYGATVDPVTNTIVLDAGNAGTPTDVTSSAAYITVWGTVKIPGA